MATIKSSNEGLILEADGANTIQFRSNSTDGIYIQSDGDMNTNGNLIHGVKNGLTSNVTYQIGSTGDFATINTALEYLSKYQPDYSNAGITVTLNLQTGYVMAEQVLVRGIDLGWITITGTDAETEVTHTSLTIDFTTDDYGFESYPVFGVSKGGSGPIINQLFRMSSGWLVTDNKHGAAIFDSGSNISFMSGAGVVDCCDYGIIVGRSAAANIQGAIFSNAGIYCIYAANNATINADTAIATSAADIGIYAYRGSTINANGADASGAGSNGIYATNGSTINADGADASGAGTTGIRASSSSTINADGADASGATNFCVYAGSASTINFNNGIASGAGQYGIIAQSSSIINANGADASGANSFGIFSDRASIINANDTDAQGLGTYDYRVLGSGIIDASGAVGTPTYSQTLNTWTADGWIGQ